MSLTFTVFSSIHTAFRQLSSSYVVPRGSHATRGDWIRAAINAAIELSMAERCAPVYVNTCTVRDGVLEIGVQASPVLIS